MQAFGVQALDRARRHAALAGSGQPSPRQIGFQEPATPIAEQIQWLHDYVNVIIFLVTPSSSA